MKQDLVIFEGYAIQKFSMEKDNNIDKNKQQTIELDGGVYSVDDKKNKDKYRVEMRLKVYTENTEIYVEFCGFFQISGDLDDDNKAYFLNVSAPAIIYPYIRTFVSTVTSLDVGETVILPIIDFASINMNNTTNNS